MASPPPTWSVTACLKYRGGLEIRAAAENILPGWGHGGEQLSFLLRVRRSLRLAVTSQCGRDPEPDKKPRGVKLLGFLRSSLARAPRVPSLLRRRKTPPQPRAAAVAKRPGSRAPAILSVLDRALMWPATATTTALCFLAALAVAAALRIMAGFMIPSASCGSWRCFLAKKFVRVLGPTLFEWLSRICLKLIKFLDPRWSLA